MTTKQPTNYTVMSRRIVPESVTHTGLVLGAKKTVNLNHGGQHAVCVKMDTGAIAWGYAADEATAEANAVREASQD